jgi:hypothetical protein
MERIYRVEVYLLTFGKCLPTADCYFCFSIKDSFKEEWDIHMCVWEYVFYVFLHNALYVRALV